MTSLDFQSLLKKEKALRQAELEQQRAPKKKIDSLPKAATDQQVPAELAATLPSPEDDRTETSPWCAELAERPLLEMDKARFQEFVCGSPKVLHNICVCLCVC